MSDTKDRFLKDLIDRNPDLIASVWIIDAIPMIFNHNIEIYASWRHKLSAAIGVDPSSLIITGSSVFGISLNPHKNYKIYDENSDVDVAVISEYHFNDAWRTLRNLGADRYKYPQNIQQSIQNHVTKYIYWGTIATDKLLPLFSFGQKWSVALDVMGKTEPTNNKTINARIYKDFDSLRAYQVNNLKKLKNSEIEKSIRSV